MIDIAKPFLAYAVTENYENTGSIIYAQHHATARRLGANEHADGDFSEVSCRRAQWADEYYGKALPASEMVYNGWHFECSGCGQRIDEDMLWDRQIDPQDVVGHQNSQIYCDARCEASDALDTAKRKHVEKRWLRRFAEFAKRRFPDAKPVHRHAYASFYDGKYRLQQVSVQIDFPGRQYAMAELSWRRQSSWEKHPTKPAWTCSAGDREAFEAYAAATRTTPASTAPTLTPAVEDAGDKGERS